MMASGAADFELHRSIVQVLVSEHERSTPPRDIEGVSRDVVACAWGFYAQINRLARASLLLIDNGMGHETYILVRVALEHAVLLHWVVERRDEGVAAVLASQSKRVNQTISTVREAQMVFSSKIERQMQTATVSTNEAKAVGQFKTVCKELNALELYFLYGVQSSFVHPSVATINSYLDAEGNPVNQPQRRVHEVNVAVLAYCLIWANRDVDTLTPGHPRAEELEKLARSIEVAPALPPYRPVPPPVPGKKRGRGGRRRR
jgi:hypothetical protein